MELNIIKLNEDGDFLTYRQGSGDTIEIYDIAVYSERRKGRGRELIEMLFNECQQASNVGSKS